MLPAGAITKTTYYKPMKTKNEIIEAINRMAEMCRYRSKMFGASALRERRRYEQPNAHQSAFTEWMRDRSSAKHFGQVARDLRRTLE